MMPAHWKTAESLIRTGGLNGMNGFMRRPYVPPVFPALTGGSGVKLFQLLAVSGLLWPLKSRNLD
jgi:hypothetical protein